METYLVLKNNLKRCCRKKIVTILLFLLPVLVLLLSNAIEGLGSHTIRIGLLADKNSHIYNEMKNKLQLVNNMKVNKANSDSIHTDLILGTYHYVLDLRTANSVEDIKLISYEKKDESKKILDRVKTVVTNSTLAKSLSLGKNNQTVISKAQRIFSFMLTVLIITATIHATNLINDKNRGTIQRYAFAPTTYLSYLLGNILLNLIFASGQMLLAFALIKIVKIPIHLSLANYLFVSIVIILISTSIGTFVTCICDSELKANVTSSCVAVLFTMLGGTFLIYEKMPELLQKVSSITPTRWIITITRNLESGRQIPNNIVPFMILVISSCILFLSSTIILQKRARQWS